MPRFPWLVATGCVLAIGLASAQQLPPRDRKPAAAADVPASPEVVEYDAVISRARTQAALNPADPEGYYRIATVAEDIARRAKSLTREQKLGYIKQGLAAIDEALQRRPDYTEALVYKNLLLRQQALQTEDPEEQKSLIASADALRKRAIELDKVKAAGPVPLPAPPPTSGCIAAAPDGSKPIRVGGSVKPPAKTRDVAPIYPPEAHAAKVAGVVILEVLIDQSGFVVDACVQRSIPLLDTAALDAVRQWEFEPTWVDGVAVPIVTTVTVNFTLH